MILMNRVTSGLDVDWVYYMEGNRRGDFAFGALMDSAACEVYGLPFSDFSSYSLYIDIYKHPNGAKHRLRLDFPANVQNPANGDFQLSGATGMVNGLIISESGCAFPIERSFVEGVGWMLAICLDSPLPQN